VEPKRAVQLRKDATIRNALTIDVEDYYHVSAFERWIPRDAWDGLESRVERSTWKILHLLEKADVQATFFILGWVAKNCPALVRAIRRAGHEIGCHSYWHRLVYEQTPSQFREDLRRARGVLEGVTGQRVLAYRAPSFSITKRSLWALDVLIEEGFRVDSSIYPTYHPRYGLPGAPLRPHRIERPTGSLWECPPPVHRFFGYPLAVGGGGYLRLFPYTLTRHWLRKANRAGRPNVVYLHPWELDPDQPRFAFGRLRTFRHYVNLHKAEGRLSRLLEDFRFGTLTDMLSAQHGVRDEVAAGAA
jgi:polysaccharide deacetylase family protein (PEP-CTERM system associated)